MSRSQTLRRSRPQGLAARLVAGTLLMTSVAAHADISLADKPLFSSFTAPGNLLLAMSVEFPTALAPAYLVTTTYSASGTYLGYFDPAKCYTYSYNKTTPSSSYFTPSSAASSHTCSGTWSGNYLNWASMHTLDTFRSVMTGGYRSTDNTTTTILTKTYSSIQGNTRANPDKNLTSGVSGATPMSWSSVTTSTNGAGLAMYFTGTKTGYNAAGPGCYTNTTCIKTSDINSATNYDGSTSPSADTVYRVYVNVKVCDSSVGVESNCVAYGSNYKPEGLMQAYSQKLRYSTFSYLNIPSIPNPVHPQTKLRDGGVMRTRMKYISPMQPVPGSAAIDNSAKEWDATTGVMVTNPDSTDANNTVTAATAAGFSISVPNSGAMNYINKFGYTNQVYKWFDPVSELYYAGLRYFKKQVPVASYSTLSSAGDSTTANKWVDGFPVITAWDDPIAYSCQKNFVLGIGDANTGQDANLPGSSRAATGFSAGNEPAMPTEVVPGDATVNVTKATNMIGKLEGVANLANAGIGCCSGTMYMGGLAYDAHTNDIRSDLVGSQTISTFWMDVLEWQTYVPKNNNWYAAKYGGFKVPAGFSPYASSNGTTTLPDASWYNTSDMVGSDKRPDNYFTAGNADAMKTGLTNAFSAIVSQADAASTTTLSFPTPNEAGTGAMNYAAGYSPTQWTGSLVASTISYASDATPTLSEVWNAQSILTATNPSNRKIVTCCTSTGDALPFTNAALSGTTLSSRTNYASFANVPGVASGSQSAANFVAYLRGDRTNELTTTSSGTTTGIYRSRSGLLGDIVNAKLTPVGPPKSPYFDASNPGYSSFARRYKDRTTVVYAGANDGMLHAFDGTTGQTNSGKELFAYIPSFVYGTSSTAATSGLASLGNPNFVHHYLVDATPNVFDVDFNRAGTTTAATASDWHSVLIGGLGKGGKGYYAIDVTDPDAWTTETVVSGKVLWEFTASTMGHSFGDVRVVKTAKYGWTAILSSGYNNSDGRGYFYFVNPKTGALLETVVTPDCATVAAANCTGTTATSAANLAHLTAFIKDQTDYTADSVYGADLNGNVWRLDLTGTSGNYPTPTLIAKLTAPDGTAQPVTTPVRVMVDPTTAKRYVMVGTGRLLDDSDIDSSQLQSFYSILDGDASTFFTSSTLPTGVTFPVTRTVLNANTDLLIGIGSSPTQVMGWYHDLGANSTTGVAERINVLPTVNNGIIGVAVNLPNGNVCLPAGSSYVLGVSFAMGKSALTSNGNAIAQTGLSIGVVSDIAFKNVAGRVRLQAGRSTGNVDNLQAASAAAAP